VQEQGFLPAQVVVLLAWLAARVSTVAQISTVAQVLTVAQVSTVAQVLQQRVPIWLALFSHQPARVATAPVVTIVEEEGAQAQGDVVLTWQEDHEYFPEEVVGCREGDAGLQPRVREDQAQVC